jgi:hypothetical protein
MPDLEKRGTCFPHYIVVGTVQITEAVEEFVPTLLFGCVTRQTKSNILFIVSHCKSTLAVYFPVNVTSLCFLFMAVSAYVCPFEEVLSFVFLIVGYFHSVSGLFLPTFRDSRPIVPSKVKMSKEDEINASFCSKFTAYIFQTEKIYIIILISSKNQKTTKRSARTSITLKQVRRSASQ